MRNRAKCVRILRQNIPVGDPEAERASATEARPRISKVSLIDMFPGYGSSEEL